MKKSTRYSAVIAAALLAVAPMAMSNVVKADEKPTVSQNNGSNQTQNVKQNGDTNTAAGNTQSGSTNTGAQSGNTGNNSGLNDTNDDKDNPSLKTVEEELKELQQKSKSISVYSDPKATNPTPVTWKQGLSAQDVTNIYTQQMAFPVVDGKQSDGGTITRVYRDGKIVRDQNNLQIGDRVEVSAYVDGFSGELEKNTWYTWLQDDSFEDNYKNFRKSATSLPEQLPESILKRIDDFPVTDSTHTMHKRQIFAETDDNGLLPYIPSDNPEYPAWSLRFGQFEPHIFTIVAPTSQTTTPQSSQATQPTEAAPSNPTPAQPTEAQPTIPTPVQPTEAQPTIPTQPTQATKAQPTTPRKTSQTTTAKKSNTSTSSSSSAAKKTLILKHNAYIYNKNGKRVGKIVLKKNNDLKVKSTKIVTIKGKKYYQVGKNQYVKVANTAVKPQATKVSTKGTVKGLKKSRIRLYDANGKALKKTVNGKKSLKFSAKKKIKGHLYYRIKGTNSWIRASKVRIHK